jgi:DNA polymerase
LKPETHAYLPKPEVDELFEKAAAKALLDKSIRKCDKCRGLNIGGVTESAPGYGNLFANVVIVGQSLCTECMHTQMPFTKGSGYYLDVVLEAAELTRQDVFITNVVHCHPRNNRASKREEVANCLPYLKEELELVQPRLVVALGKDASRAISTRTFGSTFLKRFEVVRVKHPASFLYAGNRGIVSWCHKLALTLYENERSQRYGRYERTV